MLPIEVGLEAFERLFNIRSLDEDSLFRPCHFQVALWLAGPALLGVTLPIQQRRTYHRARWKWTSLAILYTEEKPTCLPSLIKFSVRFEHLGLNLARFKWIVVTLPSLHYQFKEGKLIRRDHISLNWHRHLRTPIITIIITTIISSPSSSPTSYHHHH